MGNGVVDMFEVWEYKVTCFDKDSDAGGIFAEYVKEIETGITWLPILVSKWREQGQLHWGLLTRRGNWSRQGIILRSSGNEHWQKSNWTPCATNGHRTKTRPRRLL
jgi:hypothetical protein